MGDRVSALLPGLLDDRFTAVTVCLRLSVLRTVASFKLFERCLDLNAWNKNMSTLSVSIQFNRYVPDSQWAMMLLSQDLSFGRHCLNQRSCSWIAAVTMTVVLEPLTIVLMPPSLSQPKWLYIFFLWKCRKKAPIIKLVKFHWRKLNLKCFVAR